MPGIIPWGRPAGARRRNIGYPMVTAHKVGKGIGRKVGVRTIGKGFAITAIEVTGAFHILVGFPGATNILGALPATLDLCHRGAGFILAKIGSQDGIAIKGVADYQAYLAVNLLKETVRPGMKMIIPPLRGMAVTII